MDTKKIVKLQYITTLIAGISIISSIFIYIIIAEIIKFQKSSFHGYASYPINQVLHYGIIGIGIMPIIFINYLKDTFLNNLPRDLYPALNKLKTFTIITLALYAGLYYFFFGELILTFISL